MNDQRTIAYFSMEIGLDPAMPTYAGGLGILAGDSLRSAADIGLPVVAVSLIHREGYFRQRLDRQGRQTEEPAHWDLLAFLRPEDARAHLTIEGRRVAVAPWTYTITGVTGAEVPVYFLDTDLPENDPADRRICAQLYGGDERDRIRQEVVLGVGGLRALKALGHTAIERYHMNEGHAALLGLELAVELATAAGRHPASPENLDDVRARCVFTTHTPVPAGHDKFPLDLVRAVVEPGLIEPFAAAPQRDFVASAGVLNMTHLGLVLSRYVNGVAKRHGEVSRQMFVNRAIDTITNGVHAATWVCPAVAALLDVHIPGWREDNSALRHALALPADALWAAHKDAKRRLLDEVNARTGAGMDYETLTLGFARRATAYKRADLLLDDTERLARIAAETGSLQVVYAGKAHPRDSAGKDLIARIHEAAHALRSRVRIAYLENYDMVQAALLTAGADVWLNTPQPPMEASGTSGMKAALNGVPSLSILDGWWIEGWIEGVTGWAIGAGVRADPAADDRRADSDSLYEKLERVILPMYYKSRERWASIMRSCIAVNGSFFNTQRMMQEYVAKAYLR
jgi:starch phosphorylase